MNTVTQAEAIAHLPELIDSGQETIISREGKLVAKIVPLPALGPLLHREAGTAKGRYLYIAEDFDAPLEEFAEYM